MEPKDDSILMQILKLLAKLFKMFGKTAANTSLRTVDKVTRRSKKVEKNEYARIRDMIIDAGGNFKVGKPFLFGVRKENRTEHNKDIFNDVIGVLYGANKIFYCVGTTDPGIYWTKNPYPGYDGAARLCLGVYNNPWMVGRRKFGKRMSTVMRQDGAKMRIRRDIDKDGISDASDPMKDGWYQIQFHPMGFTNTDHKIGRWSAGCQGPKSYDDFVTIIEIVKAYEKQHPKSKYSYALFSIKDRRIPIRMRALV